MPSAARDKSLPSTVRPVPQVFVYKMLPNVPSFAAYAPRTDPYGRFSGHPPYVDSVSSLLVLRASPVVSQHFLIP